MNTVSSTTRSPDPQDRATPEVNLGGVLKTILVVAAILAAALFVVIATRYAQLPATRAGAQHRSTIAAPDGDLLRYPGYASRNVASGGVFNTLRSPNQPPISAQAMPPPMPSTNTHGVTA